jgi:hypothetical protein
VPRFERQRTAAEKMTACSETHFWPRKLQDCEEIYRRMQANQAGTFLKNL